MALVTCPDCGREVSEQAQACPGCGSPIAPPRAAGGGGNVVAGIASFVVPGLGQLGQGRLGAAVGHFILAVLLWVVLLGWAIHIFSAVEAARYVPGIPPKHESFKLS